MDNELKRRLDEATKARYADMQSQGQTPIGYGAIGACGEPANAPYTLRREAEDRVGHHRQQADKADAAAAFFRENPAFDEFVRLVRSGAIQF